MPKLLLIRPYEDSLRNARELHGMGIESIISPALEMIYLHDHIAELRVALKSGSMEGIMLTSQHAVPLLAECIELTQGLTFAVVGQHTEKQLRHAGITQEVAVYDDAATLSKAVAQLSPKYWLYLRGKFIKHDLSNYLGNFGRHVAEIVAYDAVAVAQMNSEAKSAIECAEIDGICLYSERTASIVAKWLKNSGLENTARRMHAFCLSEAVATQAKELLPFHAVHAPAIPSQHGLLHQIEQWYRLTR